MCIRDRCTCAGVKPVRVAAGPSPRSAPTSASPISADSASRAGCSKGCESLLRHASSVKRHPSSVILQRTRVINRRRVTAQAKGTGPRLMTQTVTLSLLIALSWRAPHMIVILSAPNRFSRGRTLRAHEGPLLPIPGYAQIGNSDMAPIHASACRTSQGSFARP